MDRLAAVLPLGCESRLAGIVADTPAKASATNHDDGQDGGQGADAGGPPKRPTGSLSALDQR